MFSSWSAIIFHQIHDELVELKIEKLWECTKKNTRKNISAHCSVMLELRCWFLCYDRGVKIFDETQNQFFLLIWRFLLLIRASFVLKTFFIFSLNYKHLFSRIHKFHFNFQQNGWRRGRFICMLIADDDESAYYDKGVERADLPWLLSDLSDMMSRKLRLEKAANLNERALNRNLVIPMSHPSFFYIISQLVSTIRESEVDFFPTEKIWK